MKIKTLSRLIPHLSLSRLTALALVLGSLVTGSRLSAQSQEDTSAPPRNVVVYIPGVFEKTLASKNQYGQDLDIYTSTASVDLRPNETIQLTVACDNTGICWEHPFTNENGTVVGIKDFDFDATYLDSTPLESLGIKVKAPYNAGDIVQNESFFASQDYLKPYNDFSKYIFNQVTITSSPKTGATYLKFNLSVESGKGFSVNLFVRVNVTN